jgi:hypothetical protein
MAFSHGLDINGSATVTMIEMKEFCHDMEFTRDAVVLFKALDYHRRGFIVNDDIMFLKNWNTEQHGLERFNISRARKTLNERRQHRLKLASREASRNLESQSRSVALASTSVATRLESNSTLGKSWDLDQVSWSYGTPLSTEPIVRPEKVFNYVKRDIQRIANRTRYPQMESELDYLVLKRQSQAVARQSSSAGGTQILGVPGGFSVPTQRPQTVA